TRHLFSARCRAPPRATRFPYTTLFRSLAHSAGKLGRARLLEARQPDESDQITDDGVVDGKATKLERQPDVGGDRAPRQQGGVLRSEEHTSELQSRENLVCRLLLEKKKH